jgi:RNA polymerase sigma-70 factor (ECF subfamily)
MKAWEKLDTYVERGLPIRVWLFRIARNTLIDHYRGRKSVAPLEIVENAPDDHKPLEDGVIDGLEARRLIGMMQKLTEEQREVLTLKLVSGLKTSEIAAALGKREGAVRALQMRGLQTLTKLLKTDRAAGNEPQH